jgi:diguanylate cyclase (GGDEF)-like protein
VLDLPRERAFMTLSSAGPFAVANGAAPVSRAGDDAIVQLLERRSEFRSHFQPIVSLRDGHLLGLEALLRLPPGSGLDGPADAVRLALGGGHLVELEVAALNAHIRAAAGFEEGRLFLNLSAPSFLDPRLKARVLAEKARASGFRAERVVLELTELVRVAVPSVFAVALQPFRDEGFLLAVDDFGAGFSNLELLVDLAPDFLKIDRSLVSGALENARKRVFLETLAALGRRINCAVLAEGAETWEDLECLGACGIVYGQGYALGRPAPLAEALEHRTTGIKLPLVGVPVEERIGTLAVPEEGVLPDTTVRQLLPIIERRPSPCAVPVLDRGRVVGLLTREQLFSHLGHRYGFALWHDRSVGEFVAAVGTPPDRLQAEASPEDAAERIRQRDPRNRFDPIVVENLDGHYHGLLPVDTLLHEMTRLKVEYALQASPLTALPGSLVLARVVEERIRGGRPFVLGWGDLDHFKSFNDRYGFSRGDEVLLLFATVLRRHFATPGEDFVAHPGGDDFAILTACQGAEERALAAAVEFGARVRDLYDDADRARGGIESLDRQGSPCFYDFVSASFGLVAWAGETSVDYRRLVEVAAEMKQRAKLESGPSVASNRRALDRRR